MIYTIKKGNSYWWPFRFMLFSSFNSLTWEVSLDPSMVFDYKYIEQGERKIDMDWADWKKVGGISFINWKNLINLFVKNRDAVMLARRYNVELELFEYCIYENRKGINIPYEKPIQLIRTKNGTVSLRIEKEDNTFKCYLFSGDQTYTDVNSINITPRFKPVLYSYINMWYGGADNSPGPYGGKAPKDMKCEMKFIRS